MAVYERETRVAAPLSSVWEFHSRVEGLEELTPDWMNLRVDRIVGPGGDRDPDVLAEGTRVTLSVRPFGIGPRQSWTSEIVERHEEPGSAMFRDKMVDGPFRRWIHTHSFYEDGDRTRIRDRIEYVLSGGQAGRLATPLARVGLEPMFRHRHRLTRKLLVDGAGKPARM